MKVISKQSRLSNTQITKDKAKAIRMTENYENEHPVQTISNVIMSKVITLMKLTAAKKNKIYIYIINNHGKQEPNQYNNSGILQEPRESGTEVINVQSNRWIKNQNNQELY